MAPPGRPAAVVAFPALVAFLTLLAATPSPAGHGSMEDPTGRTAIEVNFRSPPTYQQVAETQAALTRMAALICDATEGQVRLRRVRMTTGEVDEDLAAFWLHSSQTRSGGDFFADGSGLERLGSHMDVFAGELARPDRLAHLFAHHAFGLGDQFAEAGGRLGDCGFGEGFAPADRDESRHSLMQLSGGLACVAGPGGGDACLRDEDCPGSSCEAMLASEFSTDTMHDRLRGQGATCPRSEPLTRVQLRGLLPASARPITAFDATDYLTARATSSFQEAVPAVDVATDAPSPLLRFYLTHTEPRAWQLSVVIDGGEIGAERGRPKVLARWTLRFNEDSSLRAVEGGPTTVAVPGASRGGADLLVAVEVGTPNPDPAADPGVGFDGLQLTKAGVVDVEVVHDGARACRASWCDQAWNISTGAWEATGQTVLHNGASDWATIVANRPWIRAPERLPEAALPSVCATPPNFLHDIAGADQILLVLDNSQSMATAAAGSLREVCRNSLDDDGDGTVDEEACSVTRLEALGSAVSLLVSLLEGRGLHVGAMSFSTDQEDLVDMGALSGDRPARLHRAVAALEPAADSAIGAAIEAAHARFDGFAMQGRTRTAVLVTDGANNVGVEPEDVEQPFDGPRVRWHTIALGGAADGATLADLSARTGGLALATDRGAELMPLFAELAARIQGEPLVLARRTFTLTRKGVSARLSDEEIESFEIDVEEGARELVVVLASAEADSARWKVLFELDGPRGERYDDKAGEAALAPAWSVLRIPDPAPGRWRFRVVADGEGSQASSVVVYLRNPRADFFVDANKAAGAKDGFSIGATASYVTAVEGPTRADAWVRGPDGTVLEVSLRRDPLTGGYSATLEREFGRGLHEIRASLAVGDGSRAAAGEAPFDGRERAPIGVVPFRRQAVAGFYVADGPWPACKTDDCDGDGVSNAVENGCGEDIDGDGIPGRYDLDADNDEILDVFEADGDEDGDGVPDVCDPRDAPSSLDPVLADQQRAIDLACGAEAARSVEALGASVSALRRVLQNVKMRTEPSDAQRVRVVAGLEKALGLSKQAFLIADALPDFCASFRVALTDAVALEEELREQVAIILGP